MEILRLTIDNMTGFPTGLHRRTNLLLLEGTLLVIGSVGGCRRGSLLSNFAVRKIDRQISGRSQQPTAVEPKLVGTYPPDTKSGAGYFYDDVLEYRVWLHPENGAAPLNGTQDYFAAFAQYEAAEDFSKRTSGAETPLVFIRQLEWLDEPHKGESSVGMGIE